MLDTLSKIESSGNPKAISSKGAQGLFQIMPSTAKNPGFGVKALETGADVLSATVEEQTRFTKDYLSALVKEFDGDLTHALAAYNAGVKTVKDWLKGKSSLPKETIDYVKKFELEGVLPINSLNLVPTAISSFIESTSKGLLEKVFDIKTDQVEITNDDLDSRDMDKLKQVVSTKLKSGDNKISYDDWSKTAKEDINTEKSNKPVSSRVLDILSDSGMNLAMTFGAANIIEEGGKIYLVDDYDFNPGPKGDEIKKIVDKDGFIDGVKVLFNKDWPGYTKLRVLAYLLQPSGKRVKSKILIGDAEKLK